MVLRKLALSAAVVAIAFNVWSKSYDVDQLSFSFFNGVGALVFSPAVGGGPGIAAQEIVLAATNTAIVSDPTPRSVPEPATLGLGLLSLFLLTFLAMGGPRG